MIAEGDPRLVSGTPTATLVRATTTPPDPKPISASLQKHLDEAVGRIPSTGRGFVGAAVTTSGLEAEGGVRKRFSEKVEGTVSGWAGLEWKQPGWSAGVRGRLTF